MAATKIAPGGEKALNPIEFNQFGCARSGHTPSLLEI